jgi:hypothetical protein
MFVRLQSEKTAVFDVTRVVVDCLDVLKQGKLPDPDDGHNLLANVDTQTLQVILFHFNPYNGSWISLVLPPLLSTCQGLSET